MPLKVRTTLHVYVFVLRENFKRENQRDGADTMHREYNVGENSNLTIVSKGNQFPSLFNYFSADKQHQQKRIMTNEKSSLKNQRDAYFQALENDEKILKKNKRKHGNTNTKSEQMERKKQLDSKRKLALEKLQKKNKSVIITKHSQQQEVTEDEKEDQTITGIPGPPTDEEPLTREELRKFRFFRVSFPLGVKAGETIRAQIPFGPIVKVTVPKGLKEETGKERTVEFYVKNWEGMEDAYVPPPPPGMEKQYRKAKAHAEKMLERGKEVTCEIVGEDMGVKERRILSGGYFGEEEDEEEEEDEGRRIPPPPPISQFVPPPPPPVVVNPMMPMAMGARMMQQQSQPPPPPPPPPHP